jgi:BirA family transcriptional regulator, biotin operon repressor / biotin---[acetyl-CoA-carboxylase] ligase
MLHTGRSRIVLPEVASTNRESFRLMENRYLEEGTIIITPNQTAGRGQGDATWESEPGSNLTFSVILRPDFLEVSRQFLLTKVVALALHEVVSHLVDPHKVYIKWPNDIYIGNGKVAGILIENRIMGSRFEVVVAGIGLNVNQRMFHSDAPNPVSIGQITQRHHETDAILRGICHALDQRYSQLREGHTKKLEQDYLQCLLGINQFRDFEKDGRRFRAAITGVSDYGKLILALESGEMQEYDMKEISFLF